MIPHQPHIVALPDGVALGSLEEAVAVGHVSVAGEIAVIRVATLKAHFMHIDPSAHHVAQRSAKTDISHATTTPPVEISRLKSVYIFVRM